MQHQRLRMLHTLSSTRHGNSEEAYLTQVVETMRPVPIVEEIVSRILARTGLLNSTSEGGKAVHLVEPIAVPSATDSKAQRRQHLHAV